MPKTIDTNIEIKIRNTFTKMQETDPSPSSASFKSANRLTHTAVNSTSSAQHVNTQKRRVSTI
ncbi:hypothetical protein [Bifidobacterium sp. ESL0732]|uniref:hypothetical protein n=1 Tax=Bifidobacterium sp. ESL0732 TaxID=2983222 RepID=UPI0023F7909B|nr:hypothetical protein [Bifidobacterium sp. ESL0732]WEV63902.1 hypothetical protein OZX70_08245 [Bifidobacterium sp. ESL0732]